MCGIIGYTGKREASEIMLDALELLEYRGYDSAGIALFPENGGPVRIFKKAGRVHDLRELCAKMMSQVTAESAIQDGQPMGV